MIGRLVPIALAGAVAGTLALSAQSPESQDPSQTFRASVDVIEVDVSVTDKNGRPIRDLTQADFTILEDGKPQRIVSFTQFMAADTDPSRSARMSFVQPDTADNSLAERLGNGRLFAIVMDDMNLPGEDADLVIAARDAARHVVEQLGPSDQAAVVYVYEAGKTQDFTSDKGKLFDAIDKFLPNPPDYIAPRQEHRSGGGADIPYRYSPILANNACLRDQPAVPALDAVVNALAAVTGKRKTLLFISPGLPVNFMAQDKCGQQRADIIKDVFRKAQRSSINIHGIDPAGYDGYRLYMEQYRIRNGPAGGARRQPPGNIRLMHDFLKTIAENTGGRYVLDTDAVLPGIDKIFEEESSYYLLGYEAGNVAQDGKFRKITVKLSRSGLTVRSRSGYWALEPGAVVARDRPTFNPLYDFDPDESGLTMPPGVALRAAASALGPVGSGEAPTVTAVESVRPALRGSGGGASGRGPLADVVVALSVRWPAIRATASETLTITRNIYDPDGRADTPVRETLSVTLDAGLQRRQELVRRVSLPPGRHQIRYSVASKLLQRNGSVYIDVEVPDFRRSALAVSSVVMGVLSDASATSEGIVVGAPALVPTSSRDFANGDRLAAYVRIHQAGGPAALPVGVTCEVLDAKDISEFTENQVLAPEAFGADGGASYQVTLPLDRFKPGPHLLSLAARLPNGRTVRRDLVFHVR
jgi:VWFA-related protein